MIILMQAISFTDIEGCETQQNYAKVADWNDYPDIYPDRLAIWNNYTFVTDTTTFNVYVINVTNPLEMELVTCMDDYNVLDIKIVDDLAFMIIKQDSDYKVALYSLLDIQNPILLSLNNLSLTLYYFDFEVVGDYMYVGNQYPDLLVYDITNYSDFQLIGNYTNNDVVGSIGLNIVIQDNYLYLANRYGGLVILDIIDPSNPIKVADIFVDYFINAVAVEENVAAIYASYIDEPNGGVYLIDFSEKDNPLSLGKIPFGLGGHKCLKIIDNIIYSTRSFQAINISDPQNPTLNGYYRHSSISGGFAFANDLIYLAESSGLLIIDEDFDNEGLANYYEDYYETDPYNPDSDYDHINDYREILIGHDPLYWDNWSRLFGVYFIPLYAFLAYSFILLVKKIAEIYQ